MPLCTLTLLTNAAGAALIEARLGVDALDPPLAVSRFLAGGAWQVEALFAVPFEQSRLTTLLDGVVLASQPTIAPVAEQNWVAHVEATLKPIAAGPFLIHGPHDRAAAGHPFAIEIEAGGAFGTAHHATTQGCLVALAVTMEATRPRRLLDLGTGSGILAIAAAKLDPDAAILATDIDPDACRIAEANAALNGAAGQLRVLIADGLAHPDLAPPATFDLILANILAEPLVALAPGLRCALAPAGTIILSGLLAEQQASVLAAYQREGLRLLMSWPIEGWVTMVVG